MLDERIYREWSELAAELKKIKKQEMDLRKAIAATVAKSTICGTVHSAIADENGEVIGECKVVIGVSYSVDKELLLATPLSEEEKACIEWKPSLKVKDYKALTAKWEAAQVPSDLTPLRDLVTVTPNAATLSVTFLED